MVENNLDSVNFKSHDHHLHSMDPSSVQTTPSLEDDEWGKPLVALKLKENQIKQKQKV